MDPTVRPEDAVRTAMLKLGGTGRRAIGGFLAFWMCGWLLGEVFALRTLGKTLEPIGAALAGRTTQPGDVFFAGVISLFFLFWIAGWTVAGLTAFSVIAPVVLGRDPIPWLTARLPWAAAFASHRAVLMAGGESKLARSAEVGDPTLPAGWEHEPEADGSRALRPPRLHWFGADEVSYRLHAGAMSRIRGRGDSARTTRFDPARVRVQRRTDSSGVPHWRAIVEAPQGTEELLSSQGDPRPPVQLARWLADRTGMPLSLPKELGIE